MHNQETDRLAVRNIQNTRSEYEAIIAVAEAVGVNDFGTCDEWQAFDHQRAQSPYVFQRVVVEDRRDQPQIIAHGFYIEPWFSYEAGKYGIEYDVHPGYDGQGVDTLIFDYMLAQLSQCSPKPNRLRSFARGYQTTKVGFLQRYGFVVIERNSRSQLDVSNFDFTRFNDIDAHIKRQGITIQSVVELQQTDPEWLNKLYNLEREVREDIQAPDPYTPPPVETWAAQFSRSDFGVDSYFVAVDGNHYVGLSVVKPMSTDPELIDQQHAGVARTHRRRKIATALKLRTVVFAKQIGAKFIATGNDEANPMYQINLNIGFKPVSTSLLFEKVL